MLVFSCVASGAMPAEKRYRAVVPKVVGNTPLFAGSTSWDGCGGECIRLACPEALHEDGKPDPVVRVAEGAPTAEGRLGYPLVVPIPMNKAGGGLVRLLPVGECFCQRRRPFGWKDSTALS